MSSLSCHLDVSDSSLCSVRYSHSAPWPPAASAWSASAAKPRAAAHNDSGAWKLNSDDSDDPARGDQIPAAEAEVVARHGGDILGRSEAMAGAVEKALKTGRRCTNSSPGESDHPFDDRGRSI